MKAFRGGGLPVIALTISANTSDYNIRTAAGSPGYACAVIVTLNTGIIVNAASGFPSGVGMTTGTGWTAGTTINLINNGYIEGYGGHGADIDGGHAISLSYALTIDNTNGYVRGGGGGGAFGVADGPEYPGFGGGGGGGAGGGQGNPGGNAGIASTNYDIDGQDGTAGSRTTTGIGGAGGNSIPVYNNLGGDGGGGGAWGTAGDQSGINGEGYRNTNVGAAGNAVKANGYGITFLAGNNSTQVKGAVG